MPIITNNEFEEAVQAAKGAFPAWKRTPLPHRQRVMFKFQQLIRENMVELYSHHSALSMSPKLLRSMSMIVSATQQMGGAMCM